MRGAGVAPNQQSVHGGCAGIRAQAAAVWMPGPGIARSAMRGGKPPFERRTEIVGGGPHFPVVDPVWWRTPSRRGRACLGQPKGAPCHRAGTREHARLRAADQGRSPACTATPAAPGRNAEHARLDRVRQGNSAARAADQGHAGVGAHGAVVGARRRRRRTVRPQPVDAPFGSGQRRPSRGLGLRRVTPGTRPRPVAGSPGQR